jgi:hypothetical protein
MQRNTNGDNRGYEYAPDVKIGDSSISRGKVYITQVGSGGFCIRYHGRSALQVANVVIGLNEHGDAVGNQNGIYLSKSASGTQIGDPTQPTNGKVFIVGEGFGIICDAPGLVVANVMIGMNQAGSLRGIGKDGIVLKATATFAQIGARMSSASLPNLDGASVHVVASKTGNGIFCDASRVTVLSTWIGFVPGEANMEDDQNAGNAKAGVHLTVNAAYFRIGAEPLEQCSQAGFTMCITVGCCKRHTDSTSVPHAGRFGSVTRITSLIDCETAASNLVGWRKEGKSLIPSRRYTFDRPYGCYTETDVVTNEQTLFSNSDNTSSSYVCVKGVVSSPNVSVCTTRCIDTYELLDSFPLFQCTPASGTLQTPASVYIGNNGGPGIYSEASNLTILDVTVGLSPNTGMAAPNRGAAGIKLTETARNCVVGGEESELCNKLAFCLTN